MSMDELIRQWDGETVIIRHDLASEATMVIAIHSSVDGQAAGGTRMRHYPDLEYALEDAQRLARGMTHKWGAAGIDIGGAKAVIAVPQSMQGPRDELLVRYGNLIKQLNGWFVTGPDLGTTSADMDIVGGSAGGFVFGRSEAQGGAGNPARFTAWGVFIAIKVVAQRLWQGVLQGRTVVLQGYGQVGRLLTQHLVEAGATVIVAEISDGLCRQCQNQGLEVVDVAQMFDLPCDIFSPCAIGGILDIDSIAHLDCAAVVGAANNQLASIADAARLHQREILYAPDFVANCGGAIALIGMETRSWSERQALQAIEQAVVENLEKIFALAEQTGISTDAAARALADQRRANRP